MRDEKPKRPRGKSCEVCGKPLMMMQRKFCGMPCARTAYLLREIKKAGQKNRL